MQIEVLTDSNKIDLTAICRLDDSQPFFKVALDKHIEKAASRFLGTLYLLGRSGNKLALEIFKQNDDLKNVCSLFSSFRELEAKSRSLISSYSSKDKKSVEKNLKDLYASLYFLDNKFSKGFSPISDVIVDSNVKTHFPLLGKTAVTKNKLDLGSVTEAIINQHLKIKSQTDSIDILDHHFTSSGIRIFGSANQPSKAGDEFPIMETGKIPDKYAIDFVVCVVNSFANLDKGLFSSVNELMKLFIVVPRLSPHRRKAGSVSSLPGCAWQDFDPESNPLLEFCHLCVQLSHEVFHTKVNLLEETVKLYNGNGLTPELFSPWKDRKRPLRQVIHALITFSVGALVWVKLVESPWVQLNVIQSTAEEYWKENISFAKIAHKNLVDSKALTEEGLTVVNACLENLLTCVPFKI